MQNEERDMLARYICKSIKEQGETWSFSEVADSLLKEGIIAPPCKTGDRLYYIPFGDIVEECIVFAIEKTEENLVVKCKLWRSEVEGLLHRHLVYFHLDDFGKTVFKSKRDARIEIKRRKENG